MNANELADSGVEIANYKQIAAMSVDELIEYLNGWYSTTAPRKAATMLRQQQADKDRSLRVLKEVDGILLDYIEQLEKKPMTTLAYGRGVVLAVKYMIAVLEER